MAETEPKNTRLKYRIPTKAEIDLAVKKSRARLIISQNLTIMEMHPDMGHFQKLPLLWENERAQAILDRLNGNTEPNK